METFNLNNSAVTHVAKTHFYGQFTHPVAEGKLKYKDMRHNDMNMHNKAFKRILESNC